MDQSIFSNMREKMNIPKYNAAKPPTNSLLHANNQHVLRSLVDTGKIDSSYLKVCEALLRINAPLVAMVAVNLR